MIHTMKEMTYNHLNLTETGLAMSVNAMCCTFIEKSIIPTKQKFVFVKISLTFASREQRLKEIQVCSVTPTSGTSVC